MKLVALASGFARPHGQYNMEYYEKKVQARIRPSKAKALFSRKQEVGTEFHGKFP